MYYQSITIKLFSYIDYSKEIEINQCSDHILSY